MGDYIPDLTERYPEGFGGEDMFAPCNEDRELKAWHDYMRDLEKDEKGVNQ